MAPMGRRVVVVVGDGILLPGDIAGLLVVVRRRGVCRVVVVVVSTSGGSVAKPGPS